MEAPIPESIGPVAPNPNPYVLKLVDPNPPEPNPPRGLNPTHLQCYTALPFGFLHRYSWSQSASSSVTTPAGTLALDLDGSDEVRSEIRCGLTVQVTLLVTVKLGQGRGEG